MGKRLAVGGVVVTLAVVLFGPATPVARADPACVHAVVTREGAAPIDPAGQPVCQATPFAHLMTVEKGHEATGLPTGTPNGYVVTVDLPFPEPP